MQTDTTFLNPQTVISNGQFTGTGWLNPQNLLLLDGQYASTSQVLSLGADVVVGNFLFNIPQNSLISGIEISVNGYRGVSSSPATTLEIYAYDNTNGNNFFYLIQPAFSNFTTAPATYFFGSPSFLFSTTWTADQINNLKIRLQANGQLFIDNVQVRVTYTPPASNPDPVPQNICAINLQAQKFSLIAPVSQSPADVNFLLDKFQTSDGVDITNADIVGQGIPITIDQGTSNEENCYVLNITSTAGNQRLLTVSRAWSVRDPNLQDSPRLLRQHGSGAEVIIGNSIQFYDQFLRICHIGSLVSAPIATYNEGALITDYTRSYDFVGGGVNATGIINPDGGRDITVTIPGFDTVAPTVVNTLSFTSGGIQVNNFTTTGFSVTGTDRFLVVQISLESTETVTAVTFNSVALTFQGAFNQGDARVEVWTLAAPDLGVHTLNITFSGLTYTCGNLVLFNGVDQITPWTAGSANGANDNLSTGSATTSTNNAIVLHALATKEVGINYTAGGGESILSQSLTGAVQGAIQLQQVGTATTVTSNITLTIATDWANLLGSVNGLTPPSPALDHKVLVSGADTTPDFLFPKLAAGSNVTLTILNPGANEQVEINANFTGGNNLLIDQTPDNGTYGLLAGAVDGVNTTFTVSAGSYLTGSLSVFLNGLVQWQGATEQFVETTPASGTFDFITPPTIGDVITVSYQTTGGGFGAQVGIQFEDEGVNLGTPGTVNELDFTGAGVQATRVGDKVTVTINASGGSSVITNLNAGEDIDGFTEPKAVFMGSVMTKVAAYARYTTGSILNNGDYDTTIPNFLGSNQVEASTNRRASPLTTPAYDTTINYIELYQMEGASSVIVSGNVEIGIYDDNGGVPGTLIANFTDTSYETSGSNNFIIGINLGANVMLAPATVYWIVADFGGSSGDLYFRGCANTGGVTWNGSSWDPAARFRLGVGLRPFFGDVYQSYYGGLSTEPRKFILGITTNAVLEGNPLDVVHDGVVPGYTGLGTPETQYISTSVPGQIQGSSTGTVKIGTSVKTTEIVINRVDIYQ